jgi:hypothetical protein
MVAGIVARLAGLPRRSVVCAEDETHLNLLLDVRARWTLRKEDRGPVHRDSRDILRLPQHYITRPENIVRLPWEPGQLVLFDNRITALRGRQLRHRTAAAQSRHHSRRHPGRRRRQAELPHQGRCLPLHPRRQRAGQRPELIPGLLGEGRPFLASAGDRRPGHTCR